MGFHFLEGVENLAPICGMWVNKCLFASHNLSPGLIITEF